MRALAFVILLQQETFSAGKATMLSGYRHAIEVGDIHYNLYNKKSVRACACMRACACVRDFVYFEQWQ